MISIIIPALNEENYLPRLLKSIEEQDFDDYEIIVADADSEDKTKQIAEEFGAKVVKGGLPSKGRNEGAKAAKGDLFLFVDADSILPSGFFDKALKEFNQRKLDVAAFTLSLYDAGRAANLMVDIFCNWPVLMSESFLPYILSLTLVKREIHEKINGFDEEVILLEDVWYARQSSQHGKFGIIRSTNFLDTSRRFKKDGYGRTYLKYILANLHMAVRGPVKTDIFHYKFNHYGR